MKRPAFGYLQLSLCSVFTGWRLWLCCSKTPSSLVWKGRSAELSCVSIYFFWIHRPTTIRSVFKLHQTSQLHWFLLVLSVLLKSCSCHAVSSDGTSVCRTPACQKLFRRWWAPPPSNQLRAPLRSSQPLTCWYRQSNHPLCLSKDEEGALLALLRLCCWASLP